MTELTMEQRLREFIPSLFKQYMEYKDAERGLNGDDKKKKDRNPGLKELFFDLAAEAVAEGPLALKMIVLEADSADDAEVEARKRFPRWVVSSTDGPVDGPGKYRVVLEENPYFKPFTYVSPELKYVFRKEVVDGQAWLDEERLRAENLTLWLKVSRLVNEDFIKNILGSMASATGTDEDWLMTRFVLEFPEHERTLKPLGELDVEALAEVAQYIYPGKPVVKLAAPRKAKSEELE